MKRSAPLAIFAVLVLGLFMIPAPSAERLAAFRAELVLEAAPSEGAPLREVLLPEGMAEATISLGEIHFEGEDPELDRLARASLVRSLRSAAEQASCGLTLLGVEGPAPDGLDLTLRLNDGQLVAEGATTVSIPFEPPSRLSLLPPLVAIALAIGLRRPVLSLAAGVLVGAALVRSYEGASWVSSALGAAPDAVTRYLWGQIVDRARYEIILFVVFMLAMVGVITRAGGIHGLMTAIARMASSARRTQIATWFMGLAVFFDDYANTILVGSAMRPLTDRFRVAREKLAWIVDSTAAPVAGVSIFSTWIAFEVSTFSAQLPDAGLSTSDGYSVFLATLPYRFYCWLTLFFVGLVVFSGRDFGPMLRAERRARAGAVLRPGAQPLVSDAATRLEPAPGVHARASMALLPLGTFILATLFDILRTGGAFEMGAAFFTLEGATQVLYDGSGSAPLMWGALAGLIVALLHGLLVGLRLPPALVAAWHSLRSMGVAVAILYLAWMVGEVCNSLGTASWLSVTLADGLPYIALPTGLFVLSALVAFSTGSSWSTMTILLPLVVGLAYQLGSAGAPTGVDPVVMGQGLVVLSIGAVLEGAIFGDHCSPISDTTVMSSIASASDHVDHVRTQAPYAISVMIISILCGYLPSAWLLADGVTWAPWAGLGLGMLMIAALVFGLGRRADETGKASAS